MKVSKQKTVVLLVVGVALVLAIATFTYAIWSKTHTQTGVNKNTYACFEIAYKETNGEGISIENGFPQKDEDGLKNEPYEVEIKNTCDTMTSYNVILNKQTGSTLANEHLKVAVDNSYKLLSQAITTDTRVISDFSNEASYIIGSGVVGANQTKIVKIRSWMDEKTSEQDGENKSFTFKITIEAVAGADSNLLSSKILASQEVTSEKNNKYSEVSLSKEEAQPYVGSYILTPSSLYENYNDNTEIGQGYTFDEETGKFTLTQTETVTSYDGKEGWYVNNGDNDGSSIFQIAATNDYYDETDGQLSEVTDYSTLVASQYDPVIYQTNDDDGESYILRGAVNNNYVKFAEKLWRIVRINGDGTIRIILNDKDQDLPNMAFNDYGSVSSNRYKFVGYTYDNTVACTKVSPCTSNFNGSGFTNSTGVGTNSTIKGKLEEWYQTNLKAYDNKIALTTFCNDTSYGSGTEDTTPSSSYLNYGAYERLNNGNNADLHCPDPTKQGSGNRTYGGVYKLKIGLLNADEISLLGQEYSPSVYSVNGYLYHSYYWWTLSPYNADSSYANEFYGIYGYVYYGYVYGSYAVLPVINLNADTLITTGDGTSGNPYVVQ